MNFDLLVHSIADVHRQMQARALKAVNIGLTMRNWLIGAYLAWFREHEMHPGDQPPVGILLCTEQNGERVRYALAGLDLQLFVAHYQLELPAAEEIEAFLKRELAQWKEGRE